MRAVGVIVLVAFLLWIVYGSWRSDFCTGSQCDADPTNHSIDGIFGVQLNIATAMIAAISLGVAVDDTIHLLSDTT